MVPDQKSSRKSLFYSRLSEAFFLNLGLTDLWIIADDVKCSDEADAINPTLDILNWDILHLTELLSYSDSEFAYSSKKSKSNSKVVPQEP